MVLQRRAQGTYGLSKWRNQAGELSPELLPLSPRIASERPSPFKRIDALRDLRRILLRLLTQGPRRYACFCSARRATTGGVSTNRRFMLGGSRSTRSACPPWHGPGRSERVARSSLPHQPRCCLPVSRRRSPPLCTTRETLRAGPARWYPRLALHRLSSLSSATPHFGSCRAL
jgi:hypothetical protein